MENTLNNTEKVYNKVIYKQKEDEQMEELTNPLKHTQGIQTDYKVYTHELYKEEQDRRKRMREQKYIQTLQQDQKPILVVKAKHVYQTQTGSLIEEMHENEDYYKDMQRTLSVASLNTYLNYEIGQGSRQTCVHDPKPLQDIYDQNDPEYKLLQQNRLIDKYIQSNDKDFQQNSTTNENDGLPEREICIIQGVEFLPEGFIELDPLLYKNEFLFLQKDDEIEFFNEQRRTVQTRRKQYWKKVQPRKRNVTIYVVNQYKDRLLLYLEEWYNQNRRVLNEEEIQFIANSLGTTNTQIAKLQDLFLKRKFIINTKAIKDIFSHSSQTQLVQKKIKRPITKSPIKKQEEGYLQKYLKRVIYNSKSQEKRRQLFKKIKDVNGEECHQEHSNTQNVQKEDSVSEQCQDSQQKINEDTNEMKKEFEQEIQQIIRNIRKSAPQNKIGSQCKVGDVTKSKSQDFKYEQFDDIHNDEAFREIEKLIENDLVNRQKEKEMMDKNYQQLDDQKNTTKQHIEEDKEQKLFSEKSFENELQETLNVVEEKQPTPRNSIKSHSSYNENSAENKISESRHQTNNGNNEVSEFSAQAEKVQQIPPIEEKGQKRVKRATIVKKSVNETQIVQYLQPKQTKKGLIYITIRSSIGPNNEQSSFINYYDKVGQLMKTISINENNQTSYYDSFIIQHENEEEANQTVLVRNEIGEIVAQLFIDSQGNIDLKKKSKSNSYKNNAIYQNSTMGKLSHQIQKTQQDSEETTSAQQTGTIDHETFSNEANTARQWQYYQEYDAHTANRINSSMVNNTGMSGAFSVFQEVELQNGLRVIDTAHKKEQEQELVYEQRQYRYVDFGDLFYISEKIDKVNDNVYEVELQLKDMQHKETWFENKFRTSIISNIQQKVVDFFITALNEEVIKTELQQQTDKSQQYWLQRMQSSQMDFIFQKKLSDSKSTSIYQIQLLVEDYYNCVKLDQVVEINQTQNSDQEFYMAQNMYNQYITDFIEILNDTCINQASENQEENKHLLSLQDPQMQSENEQSNEKNYDDVNYNTPKLNTSQQWQSEKQGESGNKNLLPNVQSPLTFMNKQKMQSEQSVEEIEDQNKEIKKSQSGLREKEQLLKAHSLLSEYRRKFSKQTNARKSDLDDISVDNISANIERKYSQFPDQQEEYYKQQFQRATVILNNYYHQIFLDSVFKSQHLPPIENQNNSIIYNSQSYIDIATNIVNDYYQEIFNQNVQSSFLEKNIEVDKQTPDDTQKGQLVKSSVLLNEYYYYALNDEIFKQSDLYQSMKYGETLLQQDQSQQYQPKINQEQTSVLKASSILNNYYQSFIREQLASQQQEGSENKENQTEQVRQKTDSIQFAAETIAKYYNMVIQKIENDDDRKTEIRKLSTLSHQLLLDDQQFQQSVLKASEVMDEYYHNLLQSATDRKSFNAYIEQLQDQDGTSPTHNIDQSCIINASTILNDYYVQVYSQIKRENSFADFIKNQIDCKMSLLQKHALDVMKNNGIGVKQAEFEEQKSDIQNGQVIENLEAEERRRTLQKKDTAYVMSSYYDNIFNTCTEYLSDQSFQQKGSISQQNDAFKKGQSDYCYSHKESKCTDQEEEQSLKQQDGDSSNQDNNISLTQNEIQNAQNNQNTIDIQVLQNETKNTNEISSEYDSNKQSNVEYENRVKQDSDKYENRVKQDSVEYKSNKEDSNKKDSNKKDSNKEDSNKEDINKEDSVKEDINKEDSVKEDSDKQDSAELQQQEDQSKEQNEIESQKEIITERNSSTNYDKKNDITISQQKNISQLMDLEKLLQVTDKAYDDIKKGQFDESLASQYLTFCDENLGKDKRYKQSVLFTSLFYYFMNKR